MTDIIDLLEAANPFPNDRPAIAPTRSANELFADITAADIDGSAEAAPVVLLPPGRSRGNTRSLALGIAAAIAAALLITVAAMAAGPGSTSAQAQLTRAAQAAAGFDSGQADVQITGTGLPGELQALSATSTYTYNGDDYRFIETGKRGDGEDYVFELRRVDDRFYWSSPGSPGQFIAGSVNEYGYTTWLESVFTFNPKATGLDALVQIFESSDTVTQQDDGETSIYNAIISRNVLASLDRTEMPPGLAIIVGPAALELPANVALRAFVEEGVLRRLDISIDAQTTTGPMTAQITTVLSGLGSTSAASAPSNADVIEVEFAETAEELKALGLSDAAVAERSRIDAISNDLATRRPRLCIEFGTSMTEGPLEIDDMRMLIDESQALADCFRAADEEAMANVIDGFTEGHSIALEEALALEDVESRRPGLCAEHATWDSEVQVQEAFQTASTAHIACLTDAGEARAAAAVQAHFDAFPFIFIDE